MGTSKNFPGIFSNFSLKCFGDPEAHGKPLISVDCMKGGFSLDFGVVGNVSPVYNISGAEKDKPYYRDFFQHTGKKILGIF
jgi:hypothetical protein